MLYYERKRERKHCIHFIVLCCDIQVSVYTCMLNERMRVQPREEMKRAVLFTSLFALSCVYSQALTYSIGNSVLCISRYAYDVNITLHLLLLNTLVVCSFITLSVLIKKNELNWLSLPFAPQAEFSMLFEESVTSHAFNVFTLARGKQEINVTQCG